MPSQRRILAALTAEVTLVEVETANRLKDNPEYRALLTIDGIGPVMASIFVAATCPGSRPPTGWRAGPG